MGKNHDHDQEQLSVKIPFLTGYSSTFVKLTKNRALFIAEDITDLMAAELSALLMYFDRISDEMIELYIHSGGGSGAALIQIYDMMQMISAPIKTVCIGKCYSAAAVILAAGTKGERYAFKNSSVMIHGLQALFPIPGHDVNTSKEYMDFLHINNDSIMQMLSNHTGHTLDKVRKDCTEDVWQTPEQALSYGIIDKIL